MSEFKNSSGAIEAYPLAWPAGRQRTWTGKLERARFGVKTTDYGTPRALTVAAAISRLLPELRQLGARDIVVSTNLKISTRDGLPRSGLPEPKDRGVAVYFRLMNSATKALDLHCLSCDKWDRVADNVAAVAAHVGATRGQLRWGVGDIAAAFAGFKALPAVGDKRPWWQTLGFKEKPIYNGVNGAFFKNPGDRDRIADEVRAKFRQLAVEHHPDRGGSGEQMAELNAAYSDALEELGRP